MERMVITFKDGMTDYVDPVVEIKETEKTLSINNGYYWYSYRKSRIEKHEIVVIEDAPKGGE